MQIDKSKFIEIFKEHFNKIDETAIAVLKGHLLIEEVLFQIVKDFVFHGDILEEAKLSFAQKVYVSKSMSLDESSNNMWSLILAINTFRNEIAHQLVSDKRDKKLERIRVIYIEITKNSEFEKVWEEQGEVSGIAYSISLCLGFLLNFHEEVIRFKKVVNGIDKIMNPRRKK